MTNASDTPDTFQAPRQVTCSIDEMILEKFPVLKGKWKTNRLETLVVTSECIIELFKKFVNLSRWCKREYRYDMVHGDIDMPNKSTADTMQVPCRVPCDIDEMILEKFPELEGTWDKDRLAKLVDTSSCFTAFLKNLVHLGDWCEREYNNHKMTRRRRP